MVRLDAHSFSSIFSAFGVRLGATHHVASYKWNWIDTDLHEKMLNRSGKVIGYDAALIESAVEKEQPWAAVLFPQFLHC